MVRVTPVPKRSAVLAELPEKMQWSSVDKAAQVQLDESRMSATFHKGYRMVGQCALLSNTAKSIILPLVQ